MVAVGCMILRVPVPNAPPYLAEKVVTVLFGKVAEVADQICDCMLVASAAMKHRQVVDEIGWPRLAPVPGPFCSSDRADLGIRTERLG
jgi:hypothetical protein